MGKIAFVFPGQGAQYPGMGQELCEGWPAAAQVFARADALRPGTSRQCFSGTAEELTETANTQPCMFTVELAAAQLLRQAGIVPAAAAGFSLGELGALTFSGAVDFDTGFRLVCRRGQLMQADAEKTDTAMAAVVKLTTPQVEELCQRFPHVYPVNYNCPGQISVSGLKEEMAEFSQAVKQAGGRALPLRVRGGFHSPFMEGAADAFALELADCAFAQPAMTLYSDCTGLPYDGQFAHLLSRQICSPVRWQSMVEHMAASGIDTFVEVGPGNTLSTLISRICPQARTLCVGDRAGAERAIEELKSC